MEVGAQEVVHALLAMPHLRIGRPGRVPPLVVLARSWQGGQRLVDGRARRDLRRVALGIERQSRRPVEGRAHQGDGPEHVGAYQGAPRRDRGAEIVSDDRGDRGVAQCRDQTDRVAHRVQQPKRPEVVVVARAPTGGAPVAALIGGDDVEPRLGERRHDLSPGIGQLRKAVQQEDTRSSRRRRPGLEDVHAQAVDVGDEARADARGQNLARQRRHFKHVLA